MNIGVLSDTHGHMASVERALDIFAAEAIDLAIHCGDVGAVVPLFRGLRTHFVPGNVDNVDGLRAMMIAGEHTLHEGLGMLNLEGRRIAFLHGHDARLLRQTIQSGQWDLVCHGHSHVFAEHREGPTLVVNPGALWRTSQPSVALIELPSLEVRKIPTVLDP